MAMMVVMMMAVMMVAMSDDGSDNDYDGDGQVHDQSSMNRRLRRISSVIMELR